MIGLMVSLVFLVGIIADFSDQKVDDGCYNARKRSCNACKRLINSSNSNGFP